MRRTGLLLALLGALSAYGQQRPYDIRRYGALGDGKRDNTAFIQKAIDAASARGGGQVLVPAGKFVTGVLVLKSGVDLHLDAGAVLLASTRRPDYGPGNALPLLQATGQHQISITGKGTIDGRGNELLKDIYDRLRAGTIQDAEWQTPNPWHQTRPSEENRPKIIGFTHCEGVTVRGITLMHALDWVEEYKSCSGVVIDSIRVESNTFWNNDGIDLVDCKNARVTNSYFDADDDGICLKSENRNDSCDNIYVAHCKVRSSASAIKLGTAGRGGFHKITIRDITVFDTYRSAIALECVDGGRLDSVDIRDVRATNTGNAIFIRLGHRNKDTVCSSVRHIYIGQVTVEVPAGKPDKGYPMEGPEVRFPHNGFPAVIVGLPDHPVEDVVLEDIRVSYPGGGERERAFPGGVTDSAGRASGAPPLATPNAIPEAASDYPEFTMFGELPAWGLYVRHVKGLVLKNVRLISKAKDYRPSCIFDDAGEVTISAVQTN